MVTQRQLIEYKEATQMIILTMIVAIYVLFNDVFIANDLLNNAGLFTMCLVAFGVVMYRFRHALL